MENEKPIVEIKPKNMYTPICITQLICISVILIALIIIKLFFGGSYKSIQKWCVSNLLEETQITAPFDEGIDT